MTKNLVFLVCAVGVSWFFMDSAISANDFSSKFKRPAEIPYLPDNPYSAEKEELGRVLFFDPRLSGSKWISCATCHNPGLGWEDGIPLGLGHGMKPLGRHTPTILNLAWAENLFWDGRAEHLEGQALGPIKSPEEMNMPLAEVIANLKKIKGYGPMFKAAFPKDKEPITEDNIAKAIAIFERGVVSGPAPFDAYVAGNEKAISPSAARGFQLFNTKANCVACHSGWNFTDHSFHDIGIKGADVGRYQVLKVEAMKFAFKTPGLRNISQRAPYFHDGHAATLMEVIDFYNDGGAVARESKSKEVRKLHLSPSEKRDLEAFMLTLTGNDKPVIVPALPN